MQRENMSDKQLLVPTKFSNVNYHLASGSQIVVSTLQLRHQLLGI